MCESWRSYRARFSLLGTETLFLTLLLSGCSRIETVRVVNHFAQPVRIRLDNKDTTPVVPANGEALLEGKFYVGGGIRVTVTTIKSVVLAEDIIDPPGDSMFRREAVIEVAP
jgi:hypothetical protein